MGTRGTIAAGLLLVATLAGCSNETGDVASSASSTATTTAAASTTTTATSTAARTTTAVPTTTTPPPVVTTTAVPAAPVATIPRPGADQAQALYEGLLQIEPGFEAKSRETLISRARDECSSILQGLPDEKLIDNAISRFTTPDISAVTRQQGYEIVDLIRTGGWCVSG